MKNHENHRLYRPRRIVRAQVADRHHRQHRRPDQIVAKMVDQDQVQLAGRFNVPAAQHHETIAAYLLPYYRRIRR